MRGSDERSGSLFSYVDLEARVPASHPLRHIRELVNGALGRLDGKFEALYSAEGRPSIPPERLVRKMADGQEPHVEGRRRLGRRSLAGLDARLIAAGVQPSARASQALVPLQTSKARL